MKRTVVINCDKRLALKAAEELQRKGWLITGQIKYSSSHVAIEHAHGGYKWGRFVINMVKPESVLDRVKLLFSF